MEPRRRNVHASDSTLAFHRSMPVRPAARDQSQEIAERGKPLDVLGKVTRVANLDSIETVFRERFDLFASAIGTGVRPDGNRARSMSQCNRFAHFEACLRNETRTSRAEKAIERF